MLWVYLRKTAAGGGMIRVMRLPGIALGGAGGMAQLNHLIKSQFLIKSCVNLRKIFLQILRKSLSRSAGVKNSDKTSRIRHHRSIRVYDIFSGNNPCVCLPKLSGFSLVFLIAACCLSEQGGKRSCRQFHPCRKMAPPKRS
jgi:hypothetical protein